MSQVILEEDIPQLEQYRQDLELYINELKIVEINIEATKKLNKRHNETYEFRPALMINNEKGYILKKKIREINASIDDLYKDTN